MKKISFVLFLMFLFVGFSNAQKNQRTALEQYSSLSYKFVINGDAVSAVCNSRFLPGVKSILKNPPRPKNKSPLYNTIFNYTGCSSIYDLVSNGTPQNIIQDPNVPDRIHTVCMYAPPGDGTSFPNRRTKYYYSTNKGTTWTFVSDVPSGIRSGFPVVTLASNGIELISNHNTQIVNYQSSHYYYDASPGLGSFTLLYTTQIMDYYWPRTVTTNSVSLANKFVNVSAASGRDSCFWITGTSFGPTPGTFSPWHFFYSDQAEAYSIAKGSDGRIGILYHVNDVLLASDYGSMYFMESTDNGTSFGTPTKIFDANISPTGDSLTALRGMQLVYQGNVPKAVFETVKQTTSGSFFPNDGKNNIRFWSTSLPGSDPNRSIIIADTNNVGYHPLINTSQSSNDVLTCICRPSIGTSSDGTGLFVAFMVPSVYTGGKIDTISFMDVWFIHSTSNGASWFAPSKINPETPIRDWSHPCISVSNDYNSSYYYANILVVSDSVPGSYVNFSSNGESNAKYMFARVEIPRSVILTAPILIYPSNGALNVPQPVNFNWSDVTGATAYDLQISRSSDFTQLIYAVYGADASEYLLNNGNFGDSTYYWRARASNGSIKGPWSSVWSFTFANESLPSAPILIYPPNGATGILQPITFDWYDAPGATSYIFQIALNQSFTQIIFNISNVLNSQYLLQGGILSSSGTYYWRVIGTNNIGNGPSSAIWSFTTGTGNPPPAPILLYPPNGSTCISTTPTFDWQDVVGATSYGIQVSTSPTFISTVINVSTGSASQYTVVSGVLSNNTQYYWRVNATNAYGVSDWSNTLIFVTAPPTPPPATLIAPPNGATNIPLTPMLYWSSSPGATSYRLQLAQSSSFGNPFFDTITTSTQITIPPGVLNFMTVYYWRLSIINCAGNGLWSSIWVFVTNSTGINLYSSEVPTEFKLYNNFPNPFNPTTKIRFDLPKSTNVKISIYDIIGKEIAILVNENLGIGKFEVEWNASSLPSGIYFYKLETESFVAVKKLVLIK